MSFTSNSLLAFFAIALVSAAPNSRVAHNGFVEHQSSTSGSHCHASALNTTMSLYPITVSNTTIFDIAKHMNRGACDIARLNHMADVTIIPNVGQQIVIPGEVCDPDNTSCVTMRKNTTRTCIYGGPRLYYTVNGDTYEKIALDRLNITVESLMGTGSNSSATELLEPGQFVKVPLCYPSQCVMQPHSFDEEGTYKDLAEQYDTTVGQIMMLSPTYNYSSCSYTGEQCPSIDLPINCTALSSNITVLS